MSETSPTIVFHAGAHKTATTHLQHSILGTRGPLEKAGVRFFGPSTLRQPGSRIEARFNLRFNPRKSVADMRDADVVLSDMLDGGKRLVLSEENFIGTLFDRKADGPLHRMPMPLYPDAALRLNALAAKVAPENGIELCLAIRDPAGFLNSAYGLALQAGSCVAMDRFKWHNPMQDIDWVGLIGRLRRSAGIRRLTIWRYEDYHDLFDPIMGALLGPDAPRVRPIDRLVNGGLSAAAVQFTLDHHAEGVDGPLVQLARDTHPVGPDSPPHDGFDAEERALSLAFYDQQVEIIAQMDGVTLLRP